MSTPPSTDAQPEFPPSRQCTKCGQTDPWPRHVTDADDSKHFDCCAEDGCEVCAEVLSNIPEDRRQNRGLLDHVTGVTPGDPNGA